jgi:hypothetical protein
MRHALAEKDRPVTAIAKPLETDWPLETSPQSNVVKIGFAAQGAEPPKGPDSLAALSTEAVSRGDVGASIKAIEHAGSFISALSFKMRTYEKIIQGLNKTLAEHRASEESSYQRAAQAEARAKDAEEQIKRLERREQAAQEHLDRAMKAVDTSFVFQPGFSSRGTFSRV